MLMYRWLKADAFEHPPDAAGVAAGAVAAALGAVAAVAGTRFVIVVCGVTVLAGTLRTVRTVGAGAGAVRTAVAVVVGLAVVAAG
ncbi:hypothetical protein ACFORG_18250 [Lutimaribacter marinistellae]|uniref:Uncharacterized protein n=1 Tax=Lutimaribacter marinistellae TaxID=1820329 RepID=A0ABV7TL20_9RHOB